MTRAAVLCCACLVLVWSTAALADFSESEAKTRCRAIFPDTLLDPGDAGGWFWELVGDRGLLCLYGSLERSDVEELARFLSLARIDVAVVRSTGGPVYTWLSVAEVTAGRIPLGVVDEVCFSSCANYFTVVPQQLVSGPGSLVVWHGGPTTSGMIGAADSEGSIGSIIDYTALADRTSLLYGRLGIDLGLLEDTARAPDTLPGSLQAGSVSLDGYALSPERLTDCYGFSNIDGMWHAGDDDDVLALSLSKSRELAVLESPFGVESCASAEVSVPNSFPAR